MGDGQPHIVVRPSPVVSAMPTVKCHSGCEYAERPTELNWRNEWLEIEAVEQQWRTPEGKCFRVRTAEGAVFVLMYDVRSDKWRIDLVNG